VKGESQKNQVTIHGGMIWGLTVTCSSTSLICLKF
jgi:hypothetical protein